MPTSRSAAGPAAPLAGVVRVPGDKSIPHRALMLRVVDTTRRLLGVPLWAHEGLSRAEGTPVVDPELIRGLGVGQAAYIYRGGVSYVQVKRLVAAPAPLPGPVRPTATSAGAGTTGAAAAAGPAMAGPAMAGTGAAGTAMAGTGAAGRPPGRAAAAAGPLGPAGAARDGTLAALAAFLDDAFGPEPS